MGNIIIDKLSKTYTQTALDECSFEINSGELLVVLGPSGCGKSTLLNCLSGLISYDGNITFTSTMKVAMVFDDSKSIYHLSVLDNITLGMKYEGYSDSEISERVKLICEELEISELLDRKPKNLSLGQRQRMNLARALVRDYDLLLMDEPFSNLDVVLKKKLVSYLKKKHEEKKFTCVYVTHDHKEAKELNDRTLILLDGKLQQLDTYDNCKKHPANEFVKIFMED